MKALVLLCLFVLLPQTEDPNRTVAVNQHGQVEIIRLVDAKAEYQRLESLPALDAEQNARLAALAGAMWSGPECTKGQEKALLCLPRELNK